MQSLEALAQARNEFESRLAEIGDDQWSLPTPCPEWDVRALVNHMMLGTRMAGQLLDGATADEVIAGLGDDLIDAADDLASDFARFADHAHSGFSGAGGLEGTVMHPMGEIPRSMFIGFRVCDYAVHAWDLARAIGADEQLDSELVEWLWADIQPMAENLAGTGVFGAGASGTLDESAPLQDRYLDLTGRRP